MDRIFVKGLVVEAVVGVFEWEKRIRQTLRIDLEMGSDLSAAASSDDLKDTIDYKAVSKRTKDFVESSSDQLVEKLACNLADTLVAEFDIPYLKVTLSKVGAVRGADAVGIVVERGTSS